jgi:hypothetical protein
MQDARSTNSARRMNCPAPTTFNTFVPDPDGRPEAVRVLAHARPRASTQLVDLLLGDRHEVQVVDLTDEPPVPFG